MHKEALFPTFRMDEAGEAFARSSQQIKPGAFGYLPPILVKHIKRIAISCVLNDDQITSKLRTYVKC